MTHLAAGCKEDRGIAGQGAIPPCCISTDIRRPDMPRSPFCRRETASVRGCEESLVI
jgi:hypothetical protein